jgi:hypothetical protein
MKVYNAFSSKTCQYTPIFIYGNIFYTTSIPYRRFTIADTRRFVELRFLDLDKFGELIQLYDENEKEFPNEEFMLIDNTNDTEIMCILASLENKNPETLNYLIDACSHITDVRRILAMRNDLTPDMLVRLLNKEYKDLESSDFLELVSIVYDSNYSNETLNYIIRNSSAYILSIFAEFQLDRSLLRKIYHITNNNYIDYIDYTGEKLIANKNTPYDVIEDIVANDNEQITNILFHRSLPQYLYEYLLTKGEFAIDLAILNGTKDGHKFPQPLFYRLSQSFANSKTVQNALLDNVNKNI